VPVSWWRRRKFKVPLGVFGTLIALWGAYWGYKTVGAEELRTLIYQPLYSEVQAVEESVRALSIEKPPNMETLARLRRTGAFERVPSRLKRDLLAVRDDAQTLHSAVMALTEPMLREMSHRIMQLRTEDGDRLWLRKASDTLRRMSASEKGVSDRVTFHMEHAGRSRGIDVRDPGKPVSSSPGGPTFVLNDWLDYPESLKTIERLWTDVDYLYFNEVGDTWYYRITREDLKKSGATLMEFLNPIRDALKLDPNFQLLLSNKRRDLLSEISTVRTALGERIREPRELIDLISP